MSVPRYADQFLNALMDSHAITVRAELWSPSGLVGRLNVQGGSIQCDRGGSVRRTLDLTVDPSHWKDPVIGPALKPYGSQIKVWRGIRYPNGLVDEVQVFTGRLNAVDIGTASLSLHASDLAAQVIDTRFGRPYQVTNATTNAVDLVRMLIQDAIPGATVDTSAITGPSATAKVRNGTMWERERSDALDQLATMLGAEWFADMTGIFRLKPLPAVILPTTIPYWILDSGDSGVKIDASTNYDRQNIFNEVFVSGTPIGGTAEALGHWTNTVPPLNYGGVYGKVPTWYSNQVLDPNTTASADTLAATLGQQSISVTSAITATCIVNPKLQLGADTIVRVYAPRLNIDGLYYIQSMTLPLTPEDSMSLTLNQTIQSGSLGTWQWAPAAGRVPEGCTWTPPPM